MKRSPLKRTQGLRRKPPAPSTGPSGSNRPSPTAKGSQAGRTPQIESGRKAWKEPRNGQCVVCGRRGRLVRHHVVYQQHVRVAGGAEWDLRNSMDLGMYCTCHAEHHAAMRRIPLDLIPDVAIEFAIELYGAPKAALYMARHYKA